MPLPRRSPPCPLAPAGPPAPVPARGGGGAGGGGLWARRRGRWGGVSGGAGARSGCSKGTQEAASGGACRPKAPWGLTPGHCPHLLPPLSSVRVCRRLSWRRSSMRVCRCLSCRRSSVRVCRRLSWRRSRDLQVLGFSNTGRDISEPFGQEHSPLPESSFPHTCLPSFPVGSVCSEWGKWGPLTPRNQGRGI